MIPLRSLLLAAIFRSSLAQSSTTNTKATSASSTSSSTPSVHQVYVGRGNHAFTPNNITANPGDIISFEFFPTNHSVVRAAQGVPCQPYENIERDKQGFFSRPFTGEEQNPTWNLTVNDTNPVFFYCTAIDSCVVNKMIGAINANGTLLQQQEDAINENTTVMVYPGQQMAAEGSISSAASTASSTTSSVSSTSSSTSTTAAVTSSTSTSANSGSHVSISHGAIAGIAVGAAVVVALVGALFWYMGRSRMMKKALKETQQQQQQQQQRDSGFQHYPKDPSFGWGGESDGRGSVAVSYAGSPPPDKMRARALDTVYDIDRHGSPELEGHRVPEINNIAGYDERGRQSHRFSSTTSELGGAGPESAARNVNPASPIHEIG